MITVKISDKTRYEYDENNTLSCWKWCIDQFGMPSNTTKPNTRRWSWDTHYYFQFRDQADAVLFALRWA